MDAKNALVGNLIDETWVSAEEVRRRAKFEAMSDMFALRDYVDNGPVVAFDADDFASAALDGE